MNPLKRFAASLGPGFVTGAADDDPSGILTYTQTGAMFGYKQLWTVILSIPFMITIQEMCGRIGLVTGRGLASVIRTHYSRPILYIAVLLLFCANVVNIGADLGAMASVAEMMTPFSFNFWLFEITLISVLLQVFVNYGAYSKILKYLTLSLFTYILTLFVIKQDWLAIAHNIVIPSFSPDHEFVMNIVAIFGTTISPYLFFWQAGQEVEESVRSRILSAFGSGRPKVSLQQLSHLRIDTATGMIFSNLIALAIMVTAASTLHPLGIMNIETAADAVASLRPVVGPAAAILFSLGIIGTGLLAIPVLAGSASYAIAETIDLPEGLSLEYYQAKGFYAVIALATAIGVIVNFLGVPPFKMLYYTAIFNGLAAPPLMALILLICNNKKIMDGHTNGKVSNWLGWILTVFMGVAGVALVVMM